MSWLLRFGEGVGCGGDAAAALLALRRWRARTGVLGALGAGSFFFAGRGEALGAVEPLRRLVEFLRAILVSAADDFFGLKSTPAFGIR